MGGTCVYTHWKKFGSVQVRSEVSVFGFIRARSMFCRKSIARVSVYRG